MAREYAIVFLILAGLTAAAAVGIGGWAWLLLWPALSLLAVAIAYAGAGPAVFGKRPDGTLRPVNVLVLFPFLVLTWVVWHARRRVSREACWHEVVPGVYLGRRTLPGELPDGVGLVVDLTAEFAAPWAIRCGAGYRCLPTLDGAVPRDLNRLRELVREVAAFPGPVYVHCAAGHSRSAAFVAAVLVAKGLAADAKAAVRMVRAARTSARLNRVQLSSLRDLVAAPKTELTTESQRAPRQETPRKTEGE